MKYAYLNNVFISRLYLQYKNTPKQKTYQKKIAKKKILKVKWNRGNTYLLIWWRLKNKTSNLCRNLEGNERKKNRKRGEIKNGGDEKMNWKGGHWDL
jgi:hypothetical protein